jgi:hypothetical protein
VIDRLERLAGTPTTHHDPAAGDRIGIVGMLRLPELVHDVVRHVHDGTDRPHPGRDEPPLHPFRRRPVRDATQPACREARVQLRLVDANRDVHGHVLIGLRHGGVRQAQLAAGEGGDLARQPDHAERVAAIRLDVDVEHGVADDLGQRGAERDLVAAAQHVNAIRIGPQAELERAAQHPVADLAADLRPFDPPPAGQHRADQRGGHELADLEVLGTAHDLELATRISHVDARQPQGVGVRMVAHVEHAPHDDAVPVGSRGLDAVDLHAAHRQLVGQLTRRELDAHVLAQPGQRHAHG